MCRFKPKAEGATEAWTKTLWQRKLYPKHKVTFEKMELSHKHPNTAQFLTTLIHTESLQQGMPISREIPFIGAYSSK